MFTTSWSRLWNGFKFSSGFIGIFLLVQLAVPPQYQKILLVWAPFLVCLVCSSVPIRAAVSSGYGESDFTVLEVALVMGLVTAVKTIADGESE